MSIQIIPLIIIPLIIYKLTNIKNLRFTLLFLIGVMPFFMPIQLFSGFHPISKSWFNIVIVFMLSAMYLRLCIDDNLRKFFIWNKLDIIVAVYLLQGLLITLYTYYTTDLLFTSINGFRKFFFGGIIYFICRIVIRQKQDIELLVKKMVKVTSIVCILLLIEFSILNYFKIDWSYTIPLSRLENTGIVFIDSPDYLPMTTPYGNILRPIGILFHPHFTGYLIGLTVLILLFFKMNPLKKDLLSNQKLFIITFFALLLSTARTVIFMVLIITLVMLVSISRRYIQNKGTFITILVLFFFFVGLSGFYQHYFLSLFTKEDSFFQRIPEDPFKFIGNTNPFYLLFGGGFNVGSYENDRWGLEEGSRIIKSDEFQFSNIYTEIHIFHYLDETGLIGGLIFFLLTIIASKMAFKMAKKEKDLYYRNIYLGLSSCVALYLLVSIHILHSNLVLQLFNFTIIGMIGSTKNLKSEPPCPRNFSPSRSFSC